MSKINDELMKNFKLLCSVVKQNKNPELKVDLTKIEKVINEKIPETLKKNAPADYYELYTDFKSEYEKFRDFILYDELIGKNIISLGGGFSSGKSSFLNALNGERALPEDVDPTTSVPTYIVNGEKYKVLGINIFDTKVEIQTREIKKIAHGFGEIEDDDGDIITENTTLGHVLESIFLSTPKQIYSNIAFLDTPGYSKPDNEKYSAKTDEQIARGQLNSSSFILWFVQADAGTITEEDINFLKTIREDIPKLIILNKADKKPKSDLGQIIEKIKSTLDVKGIKYIDVFAFSNTEPDGYDSDKIRTQIEAWNKKVYESNFARNFKILFVRCKDFYDDSINDESRELTRLNTSITRLMGEDLDSEILEPLQIMARNAQKNVTNLKDMLKKVKELQDEFFTEIKLISDIVGIDMPEPTEIDLIKDNASDPLEVFEQFKKSKGIKTDPTMVDTLMDTFSDIKPTFNKNSGGSEYADELMDVIKENHKLSTSTDYTKNLYLEMLAVIIRASGDIKPIQTEFLTKTLKGVDIDEKNVQDFYKSAIEINVSDYENFCERFKNDKLKYRFFVDTLTLYVVDSYNNNQMKLIANIMAALNLTTDEVKYLSLFIKYILIHDPNILRYKGYKRPSSIDIEFLSDYMGGYMNKLVHIDRLITDEQYNLTFTSQNDFKFPIRGEDIGDVESDNRVQIRKKSVSFKNVNIRVLSDILVFDECDLVEFDDCMFTEGSVEIRFQYCKEIYFRNCKFKDFTWLTLWCYSVERIYIENCHFKNCVKTGNYGSGVDLFNEFEPCVVNTCHNEGYISFEDCIFEDCGGRCDKKTYSGSIICNSYNPYVKNCKFYNCWHYHKENEKSEKYILDPNDYNRCLFWYVNDEGGNVVNNSAKLRSSDYFKL